MKKEKYTVVFYNSSPIKIKALTPFEAYIKAVNIKIEQCLETEVVIVFTDTRTYYIDIEITEQN